MRNSRAVVLLLASLWIGKRGMAQSTYNYWEARPVATPQSVRAKPQQVKIQQDSLQAAAYWTKSPLLKRGIGQRILLKQLLLEDTTYFHYTGRTTHYPIEALRAQAGGRVSIRLTIDPSGKVVASQVVETTIPPGAGGEANMVQEALRVMRQLRFEPATSASEETLGISYKFL